jgi:mannose-6-phosphate isomerase-like protein (cupin superfamily)
MTRLAMLSLVAAVVALRAFPAAAAGAVDVAGSEIDSALQRTAAQAESDQQLRVVNVGGQYNVGIAVVHRARTANRQIGPAGEHSAITEVFHFISGTATLVTGGTLQGGDQVTSDPLTGPGIQGGKIINGHRRAVGPGDVVVIPPNTPVQFTEVTSGQIVYLVVRIDPQKVLQPRH